MATKQVRRPSSWQMALREFNKTQDSWVIPSKGSKAYSKVKKLQERMTKAKTKENVQPGDTAAKVKKPKKVKAKKEVIDVVSDDESGSVSSIESD